MNKRESARTAKFRSAFKYSYILIAFGFMAYYLVKNWYELSNHNLRFDYGLLILAVLFSWAALLWPILSLKLIYARIAGYRFSLRQMFRIFNLSFIGRYLPGKVWSVLGMVYYTGEYGIGRRVSLTAVVVNEICFKGSGLLLGLFYLIYSSRYVSLRYIIVTLMLLSLIAMNPRILNSIVNYFSRLLKLDRVEIDVSYRAVLSYFLLYLIFWGIYSVGFYFLVQAISPVIISSPLKFLAILPLAWTVGYLVVFIPGGIGIREGMLVALLSEYMNAEVALVIALSQRLISLMIEGINTLMALSIKR